MHFNPGGYNIVAVSVTNDSWYLRVVDHTVFTGTMREVALYAVQRLGFKFKEIHAAFDAIAQEGHNVAHFGMNKDFIYSSLDENVGVPRKAM